MPEKTFHITSSKVYNFVYDGEHWVFVGDCNTDKYVQQNTVSYNDNRPLLLSYSQRSETNQSIEALGTAYMSNSIYANAATGTVSATNFNGKINNHTVNADVPSNAVFTDTTYTFGAGLSTSATNVNLSLVSTTPTANEANVTNHVYPIEVDKNGKLAVMVPWVNTNSTYTNGDGLELSNGEFSHYYPLMEDAEGTYTPSAESAYSIQDITVDAFGHIVSTGYSKKDGIYYLTGNSTDTKGVWTATEPEITAYYDGLTILFVPSVAGGSSSTTLEINNLGPITCYTTNTTNMTGNYSVGTPILLTYSNEKWRRADYNSNTTYSAMSVAEQTGGTATSARTITAAVLRQSLVGYADTAGYAITASNSIYAASAGYATTASNAINASIAVTAGWAVTAGNAIKAHSAAHAITAGQAITAGNAVKAHCAAYAITASWGIQANCANYASTAGYALNATNAVNATKATQDASGNVITSTYATKTELNALMAASDAMVFKGTLGTTNGATRSVPTQGYLTGWTYKIVDGGTYAGQVCEPGDLLIAITDGPESGTTVSNGHWTVVQTNIDGAVTTSQTSSTSGSMAIFTGTSGKTITKVGTVGTATKPIYIDSNGRPQTITSYEGMAGSATFATSATEARHAASANYAMSAAQATHAASAVYSLSAASASYAALAGGLGISSTTNAIAYFTDTSGTFGAKASANGVLFSTAANGALNWGILPIAQGGTSATGATAARANLSAAPAKQSVFYGVCATAQETLQKDVALIKGEGFVQEVGTVIVVYFNNASANGTSNAPMTMKVENNEARNLLIYNNYIMTSNASTSGWPAGAVVPFILTANGWTRFYWNNTTYNIDSVFSNTDGATAAKVGQCTRFALTQGFHQVLIMYSNTAKSKLTLNINGTGAKDIWINDAISSSSNYTLPQGMYLVYFDRTNFYFRTDGLFCIQATSFPGVTIRNSTSGRKGSFMINASGEMGLFDGTKWIAYSDTAGNAYLNGRASCAVYAATAGWATSSGTAITAGYAITAAQAIHAASANYSASAAQATHSASANYAMISSAQSTAKLFMLGTTAQAASNIIPYTNTAVYSTAGAFAATSYRVAEKVILQYNTSTEALDFVFV